MELSQLLHEMRLAIEADLEVSLAPLTVGYAQPIGSMISYHLGWNQPGAEGKRVRPIFTLLCCAAAGGDWKSSLPAASAIEWIHNFSLIHDDIEDQSSKRRGRETLWAREGIAQAINTGDSVFALARLAAQRLVALGASTETTLQVMAHLDQACLDLTIGQHLDIAFESRSMVNVDEYMAMIAGKTAALLEAACVIGATIAGGDADHLPQYRQFGRNVGLAFQMYDDLLGIWGEVDVTGKPAGDDLAARKKTLPLLYGMENSSTVVDLWTAGLEKQMAVESLILALEESGARAHVLQQAESFTRIALEALRKAQPLQPFGEELERLALSLLQRAS